MLVLVAAALAAPAGRAEVVAPRIVQTVDARFPDGIDTHKVVTGAADLVITIDAEGRLEDWLVVGYTLPGFADEAVRALQQWRYHPALVDGRPVGCRLQVSFSFTAKGKVVLTEATGLLDRFISGIIGPEVTRLLCRPEELDRPIATVQTAQPPDPGAIAPPAGGRVLVDFYVDAAGHPRLPVIVSATEELYAKAAVSALARWRFQPPTRTGQPVAVRVQEEFVFPGRT